MCVRSRSGVNVNEFEGKPGLARFLRRLTWCACVIFPCVGVAQGQTPAGYQGARWPSMWR